MKKIQLLSIMILSGAIAFGANTTAMKAKVNFQESTATNESTGLIVDLTIDYDQAIHGLQFDIRFNPSEILSITPQPVSGFEVKYNELSEGLIRGLVFSLQGEALPKSLPFEFKNVEGFNGNTTTIEFVDIILADSGGKSVDIEDGVSYDINLSSQLPIKTELTDSYPNPFNPTTSIYYNLGNDGHVAIMIYDAAGRLVEELMNGYQDAGENYSLTWNASNHASGMYFAKMVSGDVVQTQKLVLLK